MKRSVALHAAVVSLTLCTQFKFTMEVIVPKNGADGWSRYSVSGRFTEATVESVQMLKPATVSKSAQTETYCT